MKPLPLHLLLGVLLLAGCQDSELETLEQAAHDH
jgi:hypothetical protein